MEQYPYKSYIKSVPMQLLYPSCWKQEVGILEYTDIKAFPLNRFKSTEIWSSDFEIYLVISNYTNGGPRSRVCTELTQSLAGCYFLLDFLLPTARLIFKMTLDCFLTAKLLEIFQSSSLFA